MGLSPGHLSGPEQSREVIKSKAGRCGPAIDKKPNLESRGPAQKQFYIASVRVHL